MEDLKTIKQNHSYIRTYLISVFILFVLIAIFYTLWGYKEVIPTYMEVGRLLFAINYAIMIVLSFKLSNHNRLFFIATLGFLFCALLMKYIYYVNGIETFGNTVDSYNYYNITMHNGHKNIYDFYKSMPVNLRVTTADYGYYFILYLMYKINPDMNWLIYGLIFINAVCLYISAIYLYRAQLKLKCNPNFSKTIVIFYISSPFLTITAVNGLKEIIFVTIIIIVIYKIICIKQHNGLFNIIHALLGIIACLFFRTAVAYMLLITLFVALTLTENNKLAYLIIMITGVFFFNFVLPFILENLLGVTMDDVAYTKKVRLAVADTSNSLYTMVLPLLSAIIGPFPNFDRSGEYTFMFSLSIFLKNCFTVFFIVGFIKILRKQMSEWYPIMIYILISMSMIYIGAVSLDFRYHITFFPPILLIISRFFRRKPIIDYTVIMFFIMFIYIYSTRRIHSL